MKLLFEIDLDKINDIQVNSLRQTIERTKHAHFTDIRIRINGKYETEEADWLKHLTEITDAPNAKLTGRDHDD